MRTNWDSLQRTSKNIKPKELRTDKIMCVLFTQVRQKDQRRRGDLLKLLRKVRKIIH